jgi:putative DNA primase/helicase
MTAEPAVLHRRAEAELAGMTRDGSGDQISEAVERAKLALSKGENLTDLGNARRFVAQHGDDVRYCHPWARWLHFDGNRWRPDQDGEVERRAKGTVVSIYAEASNPELSEADRKRIAGHAKSSESESRIRAMLGLARSEPGIPVPPDRLDADPYLLGCGNGTVDLRTGKLRRPDRADLLTRGTNVPFEPNARCPRWLRCLEEVFDGDRELIAFVKRWIGYTLTGATSEHVLAVLYGTGRNGKTTIVETVKRLLGDLAAAAPFDTFARVRGDRGPRNDLARLHRVRMVAASESGKGRRLDEATVKQLTGGDTIAARFLYSEYVEFRPEFKLWLVTNHRPRVDGGDDAIWARLRLIPFEVSFKGREDRQLEATLADELPGILRWAVEGCVEWQRDGLGTAPAVDAATDEYREDEDVLGAFLAERCEREGEVEAAELRRAFEEFCREVGEDPPTASVLGKELANRGVTRGGKGRRIYRGVSLR